MSGRVALSVDQFYRPQPGGIATYAAGLVRGLRELERGQGLVGVAPRGEVPAALAALSMDLSRAPVSSRLLVRLWPYWPLGVPRDAAVVHATSMAGPFAGGARGSRHSVALHDLLWRDEATSSTPAGVRFHERRLALIRRRRDLVVLTSSPGLAARLAAEGIDEARLHPVRLGVDDAVAPAPAEQVRAALVEAGVDGPYTLYVGTREPRKNLDRLVAAHRLARARADELGSLVLVGPPGWGDVDSDDAVVLGPVARSLLLGLYRDAVVCAYVPLAEGWGLPPVEALHVGTRVVASIPTPSVSGRDEVVVVDPHDVEAIAEGLVRALALPDDDAARARRRASVAELTWRNCALDHLAGWS
ncbi:MAG: glycosyltransferase [Acidimicrobiales bacterium]